jgi:hypothetical protein
MLAGKKLEAAAAEPSIVMNITTSPKIWSYPTLLRVVHQANEAIEREAGPVSGSLAVVWSLVATTAKAGFALQVTVVDASSPQSPLTVSDVTDLPGLLEEFRKWCRKDERQE